jgi:hypothetical protein
VPMRVLTLCPHVQRAGRVRAFSVLKASLTALAARLRREVVAHLKEGPKRDVRILYEWSANRKLAT